MQNPNLLSETKSLAVHLYVPIGFGFMLLFVVVFFFLQKLNSNGNLGGVFLCYSRRQICIYNDLDKLQVHSNCVDKFNSYF